MAIEVRNITPKNDASNVPIETNMTFDLISTDGDQIDISTLSITLEVVSLITGDTLSNDYLITNVAAIQYQGDSNCYRVLFNPETVFEQGMTVTIKINVSDNTPSFPVSMDEYSISFTTVYNDLISDFKYTIVYQAQNIPVYNEILLGNSTTAPQIFNSAFRNWNIRPRVEIKLNQVITESGFSIDYSNGQVIFDEPLEYNDQVEASYTFKCISDDQVQSYFKQASAIWRISPPSGGPLTIYAADTTIRSVLFIGAAQFAFNDLIFSLALQERRIIFDNRSWDEAWKSSIEIFKSLRDFYKDQWKILIEAKKVRLPQIASIVTPEYALPGGRSRFFRYLYKDGGS